MDTVRNYPPLAKADEDVLIARAVRGEAQAMAEMSGRYRGLIMAQAHASYLRCGAPSPRARDSRPRNAPSHRAGEGAPLPALWA